MRAILDALSTKPGHEFTVTELAEATELTPERLRGGLSALTRHLNKHFDGMHWPFAYRWTEAPGEDDGMRYYIREERAAQWRSIRAAQKA